LASQGITSAVFWLKNTSGRAVGRQLAVSFPVKIAAIQFSVFVRELQQAFAADGYACDFVVLRDLRFGMPYRTKKILWSDHFTMVDNPNLVPEFVEAQKRLYTGFFYKRFIEGLWVVAEGAIYKDSWSEDLLYDLKDEPVGLRSPGRRVQRIIPIDYGTTNPMVFLDIYDDGKLYWIVREYYWDSAKQMRQKTDAEYADDLADFIGPQRNAKVIVDPSAASFKAEMTKRGIWHVDADNDVNEGIRIVSMVLNQRMARFCRQTAPNTIQEMQTYAWDAKAVQRGEEKPLKLHDHGPDAFRYFAKTEVPYWRLAA
jgi:PBSX family phage terminase large subunit